MYLVQFSELERKHKLMIKETVSCIVVQKLLTHTNDVSLHHFCANCDKEKIKTKIPNQDISAAIFVFNECADSYPFFSPGTILNNPRDREKRDERKNKRKQQSQESISSDCVKLGVTTKKGCEKPPPHTHTHTTETN